MRNKIIRVSLFLAIFLSLMNCAKRGTPNGGPRDEKAPELLKASPELNTTDFKTKKIKLTFDEYVKLEDLQKHLIISPPLNQFPEIRPQGSASKSINITIKDTLKENTTYVFNFGQSIVDNNEGNPYQFFKYVFSTGDYIDSLTVNGFISDAKKNKAEDFVSVMLYEVDSTFNDSTIYKKPPNYITNTLDSMTTFQLSNLRAGKYMLLAIKDIANNNLFNQKTDKIAFIKDFIEVPTDSVYELKLFKEINDYRATNPSLISKNRIIFGYEGNQDNEIKIELLSDTPDDFRYTVAKEIDKDTLNYWFTPFEADSLLFKVSHLAAVDTFSVRIKDLYRDSLVLKSENRRMIKFEKPFIISSNTPLVKHDIDKISLLDKDSVSVNFNAEIDTLKNQFRLTWDVKPSEEYKMRLLPGALEDFYGDTNDTLNYFANSRDYSDYGSIGLSLQNVSSYPLIIQLTNEKGDVIEEKYVDKPQPVYDFEYLDPGNYLIRVIFDTNGNRRWDTGNYLKKLQPERISYYPDLIELRANWERQYRFILD
ncbi:hypothetical protein GTQ40_09500 [Flavobacteriaceae bacterium R38]|nr:hypothetical protein [Flavobacteriaceae bacterium R38]